MQTNEQREQDSKRGYTVVLVPEGNGKIQRAYFSAPRLRRLLYGTGVLTVVLMLALGYSLYSMAKIPERRQMAKQLLEQRLHLARISAQLDSSERALERVRRLDRKLRIALGEGLAVDDSSVPGIGGPGLRELNRYDGVADSEARLTLARLDAGTRDLEQAARTEEGRLQDLQALVHDRSARLASTPSILPTRGWITSGFGMRTSPFTGIKSMHEGLDVATRIGNPVKVTADGVVTYAGVKSGYGKVVIVDHGFSMATRYGHLSAIEVEPGQEVRRGELVGRVGNTGRTTGPHLHYEVRLAGVPVNPKRYILLEDQPH